MTTRFVAQTLDLVTAETSGGFIEPALITDVFTTDLAAIDELGAGIVRLTFTARQRGIGDTADEIVVSKLVLPSSLLVTMAVQLAQFDGRRKSPIAQPQPANSNQTTH